MPGTVTSRIERGIAWLVLDNPERRNAMTLEMQSSIPHLLAELEADDEVRVVVVRGAGETAFVAGADISEFDQHRSTPETVARYGTVTRAAFAALASCSKPTLSMIHGFCIGGGLALAACTDLRFAADDATFAIPAAKLGIGYAFDGVHALVQLVGPAFANEILFTARRLDSQEALRIGLVNRVVPKTELEGTVRELAATIAANAPLTLRASKVAVRQSLRDPDQRDLDACQRAIDACANSADYVEGRRAFLEKRPPRFVGR